MQNHTGPYRPQTFHLPDGDHLSVSVEDPGYVEVRGRLDGDDFTASLRWDAAMEEARLMRLPETPDLMFPGLPDDDRQALARALDGAGSTAWTMSTDPWEPDEDRTERVALDGGHVDVDTVDEHVELVVTIGERASIGLALTPAEAERIGDALTAAAHRAHVQQAAQIDLEGVETVTDLYRTAQATGIPAAALVEVAR